MTHGVSVLVEDGTLEFGRVVETIQTFDDFNGDNDPYGEHDFSIVTVDGVKIYWKIDYYDQNCQYGSEDPTDPEVTTRVITILLPEEY